MATMRRIKPRIGITSIIAMLLNDERRPLSPLCFPSRPRIASSGRFLRGRLSVDGKRPVEDQVFFGSSARSTRISKSLRSEVDDHIGLEALVLDRFEIGSGVVGDGHVNTTAARKRHEFLDDGAAIGGDADCLATVVSVNGS